MILWAVIFRLTHQNDLPGPQMGERRATSLYSTQISGKSKEHFYR